jgi:hypothetical protein
MFSQAAVARTRATNDAARRMVDDPECVHGTAAPGTYNKDARADLATIGTRPPPLGTARQCLAR